MAMKLVIGINTEVPTGEALEGLKVRARPRTLLHGQADVGQGHYE